jgi:hypothetical protein
VADFPIQIRPLPSLVKGCTLCGVLELDVPKVPLSARQGATCRWSSGIPRLATSEERERDRLAKIGAGRRSILLPIHSRSRGGRFETDQTPVLQDPYCSPATSSGPRVDPVAALAAVQKADEALSLIAKLMAKLRAQPDAAALKLSAALDEIAKTYEVVDRAFSSYAALAIDDGALSTRSFELLSIAGGGLSVRVKDGRGDCNKINNIYQTYLRRWFERALNPTEQLAMEQAFIWPDGLSDADDTLFRHLTDLAGQLQSDATAVLDLVYDKRLEEARASIWLTYLTLRPVQEAMGQSLQRMLELKNDLILLTGTP